jgi:polar amino acid transport system permease protein
LDLHQLLALDVLPQLLRGAAVTLKITLITAILAFILSFVVGFLRLMRDPWVRRLSTAYVEILRGTSAIVQLYYLFFILPVFGISLPPTTTAVIGLGLNLSAYGSEIVRAGILAIGQGQHEGAAALGLNRVQTYRLVILPQALVGMLPSFGNLLIDLVKATSLVSLITITELTFSGRQMVVTTGHTVEVWTWVMILYFAMAYPLTWVVRAAERYAARYREA